MKTLLLSSLLFCQVFPGFSQDRAPKSNSKSQIQDSTSKGPFGFEAGMNKKQIAALVGGEAKLKFTQNNSYSLESVPNPHPLFETYSLCIDPNQGLIKIIACSRTIATSRDGNGIKDKFKEVGATINAIYGMGETYDYLKVSSTLREPEEWMTALLKKERVLASYWLKKNIPSMKHKLNVINLETVALSPTSGVLFLNYEFEGFGAPPEKQKSKTNASR